jgi:hypothetical protein
MALELFFVSARTNQRHHQVCTTDLDVTAPSPLPSLPPDERLRRTDPDDPAPLPSPTQDERVHLGAICPRCFPASGVMFETWPRGPLVRSFMLYHGTNIFFSGVPQSFWYTRLGNIFSSKLNMFYSNWHKLTFFKLVLVPKHEWFDKLVCSPTVYFFYHTNFCMKPRRLGMITGKNGTNTHCVRVLFVPTPWVQMLRFRVD